MHGGNVELRNRSGGGLEARVRLPLGLMLQQGRLWASNGSPGLCMHMLLPAAQSPH